MFAGGDAARRNDRRLRRILRRRPGRVRRGHTHTKRGAHIGPSDQIRASSSLLRYPRTPGCTAASGRRRRSARSPTSRPPKQSTSAPPAPNPPPPATTCSTAATRPPKTTAVCAEYSVAAPAELVAVTPTRKRAHPHRPQRPHTCPSSLLRYPRTPGCTAASGRRRRSARPRPAARRRSQRLPLLRRTRHHRQRRVRRRRRAARARVADDELGFGSAGVFEGCELEVVVGAGFAAADPESERWKAAREMLLRPLRGSSTVPLRARPVRSVAASALVAVLSVQSAAVDRPVAGAVPLADEAAVVAVGFAGDAEAELGRGNGCVVRQR